MKNRRKADDRPAPAGRQKTKPRGSTCPKKIVLVGGGSRSWTPEIVRDMMLQPELQEALYVINDPDPQASDLLTRILQMTAKALAPGAQIVNEPNVAKAFTGADAFLITISTGGLPAMEHDLKVPESFGIYHTVGDTSGPGGWARSLRNIPVFSSLAAAFNRYAPEAIILNYTNPMTVLTDVLCRVCRAPVVGLCHGLFENLEFFARLHHVPESEINVRYAGLNHFFWLLDARIGGIDLLADLTERLAKNRLSVLLKEALRDRMGYASERDVAEELWRTTGVFPYLGDRHTAEFFSHFITKRKTLVDYRLKRTSIPSRKDALRRREAQLRGWLKTGVFPNTHLTRSRESAADILSAWFSGRSFIDVGNVPNIGQIANLAHGVVVETPVRIDRTGFTPLSMGELPRTVLPMVEPWVHVFRETAEAGLSGSLKKALFALRLDPVVSHLTTPQVVQLGQQLLAGNRAFTSYLKD